MVASHARVTSWRDFADYMEKEHEVAAHFEAQKVMAQWLIAQVSLDTEGEWEWGPRKWTSNDPTAAQ